MKTIEYFVLRHGEEGSKSLSELGIKTSLTKGEEILELIGDIGNRVVKIIHSDTLRAKETAENIAKGMGIIDYDIIETYGRQNAENFAKNVSIVVGEFIETNLIIIVIGHLHNIYNIAEKIGYLGRNIRNPKNLEGYHFKTETDEILIRNKPKKLKNGDIIDETGEIITEIGISEKFGNKKIIGVYTEGSEYLTILDIETYEIIKINFEGKQYRIINFWKASENPECSNYYVEIIKDGVKCELIIDAKTLQLVNM